MWLSVSCLLGVLDLVFGSTPGTLTSIPTFFSFAVDVGVDVDVDVPCFVVVNHYRSDFGAFPVGVWQQTAKSSPD